MKKRSRLVPDQTAASVYDIDFDALYESGIDFLIFDLDNTLLPQDDMNVTLRLKTFFESLFAKGFTSAIVSNNSRARIEPVADELDVDYVHSAAKPSRKSVVKAMRIMEGQKEATALIGDQLTDVFAGNKAGVLTILVRPLDPTEHFFTKIKRSIERMIMKHYNIKLP